MSKIGCEQVLVENSCSASGAINVLHIEDNPAYSRLIQEYMFDVGAHNVKIANCTKMSDALSLVEDRKIDVVLLDLSLPDATGIQNVQLVHQSVPDIAVIVLTGTNSEDIGLSAVQLGAQDYLAKDMCSGELLLKTIKYALERQRIESDIRDQALTDGLTSLPNRAHFMESLDKSMTRAKRTGNNVVLLYLDFDGFKQINDSFGHHEGDAFLKEVSRRLKGALRNTDFCARLGGDEFAVVADLGNHPLRQAMPLMEKILEVMREPHITESQQEVLSFCSIGAAMFCGKQDDLSIDVFIQRADQAMYQAKREGGDCYRLFHQGFEKNKAPHFDVLGQLRGALEKEQFFLEFQPVVKPTTSEVCGVEALLRWRTDNGDTVSPKEFIQHLEHIKIIHEVGEWVFDEACRQFHEHFANAESSWLSINISPLQLNSDLLLSTVSRNLKKYAHNSPWLVLEVAESIIMKKAVKALEGLNKLDQLGVVVAIDNFGTGYTSMQYLMDLPAKLIKIDGSFAHKVAEDNAHEHIINGMIQLAHALEKEVVIEGVESDKVLSCLNGLNADYFQGFAIAKPSPIHQVPYNR